MNSFCRIAASADCLCAIAGFAPAAIGAEGPTDKPASPGRGWYVGTGIGRDSTRNTSCNGQSISFDDRLRGATDKSPLIALNIVNAGIALSRACCSGSAGRRSRRSASSPGNNAHLQINNYFCRAHVGTSAEQGFFVRGGGGLSNILIDTGVRSDRSSGFGILLGAGYAFQVAKATTSHFTVRLQPPVLQRIEHQARQFRVHRRVSGVHVPALTPRSSRSSASGGTRRAAPRRRAAAEHEGAGRPGNERVDDRAEKRRPESGDAESSTKDATNQKRSPLITKMKQSQA